MENYVQNVQSVSYQEGERASQSTAAHTEPVCTDKK